VYALPSEKSGEYYVIVDDTFTLEQSQNCWELILPIR
jgi:hypothetical protein